MIILPNAEEVNSENVVEKLKQTLKALQEMSDSSGTSDMTLAIEIRGLRQEMKGGFVRLENKLDENIVRLENKLDENIDRLETKLDENIDRLETKLDENIDRLENKLDTHLSEQTEILKMIAENTKKRPHE